MSGINNFIELFPMIVNVFECSNSILVNYIFPENSAFQIPGENVFILLFVHLLFS